MAFEYYVVYISKAFQGYILFLAFMVIFYLNLLNDFVFLRRDFVKNYICYKYLRIFYPVVTGIVRCNKVYLNILYFVSIRKR